MAEDTTPLVEALLAIIDAARAYLPPDGIGKPFNPNSIAAMLGGVW